MSINWKRIIFSPVLRLISTDTIRKPIIALLNNNPRLKRLAKELYDKYLLKNLILTTDNASVFHRDNDLDTSKTYNNLMDYVLERNSYNADLNKEINRLVLALREMNREHLELQTTKKKYRNLIVACYLYLLRRYPSENDIDLWTDHFAQGITVFAMLDSLKASPEFQQAGVYYL